MTQVRVGIDNHLFLFIDTKIIKIYPRDTKICNFGYQKEFFWFKQIQVCKW